MLARSNLNFHSNQFQTDVIYKSGDLFTGYGSMLYDWKINFSNSITGWQLISLVFGVERFPIVWLLKQLQGFWIIPGCGYT